MTSTPAPFARLDLIATDLKDEKFGRAEKPGVARLVAGIALTQKEDEARLSRGAALLDDLHESFIAALP